MGIVANSSVLTKLSFVIKNLKNSGFVSQSEAAFIVSSQPIESGNVNINFS